MNVVGYVGKQIEQIRRGGSTVFVRKINTAAKKIRRFPFYLLAVPGVLLIRLLRPWLIVRLGGLISARIGHFAANTEMCLCEHEFGIDKPPQRHLDLFYFAQAPISNYQLATMWKRTLRVWPEPMMAPIDRINRLLPSWQVHDVGIGLHTARDIHRLYDQTPPRIAFSEEEEVRGEANLRLMGIPPGASFVCLNVRDAAYLDAHHQFDWSYQSHRDSDIDNFLLAAEELANRGYYVIRMGAKVNKALRSCDTRVIDYATNGMRTDFMDIYLGAKCAFCISTGTGWDHIPTLFRRPIAFVNHVPLTDFITYLRNVIHITKRHWLVSENRELTLREIAANRVGFCGRASDYDAKGVKLIENTPQEIRDVAVEMAERLSGIWQPDEDDEALQQRFWQIYPTDALEPQRGTPIHGVILSRFGASFLRNNRSWLD